MFRNCILILVCSSALTACGDLDSQQWTSLVRQSNLKLYNANVDRATFLVQSKIFQNDLIELTEFIDAEMIILMRSLRFVAIINRASLTVSVSNISVDQIDTLPKEAQTLIDDTINRIRSILTTTKSNFNGYFLDGDIRSIDKMRQVEDNHYEIFLNSHREMNRIVSLDEKLLPILSKIFLDGHAGEIISENYKYKNIDDDLFLLTECVVNDYYNKVKSAIKIEYDFVNKINIPVVYRVTYTFQDRDPGYEVLELKPLRIISKS